MSDKTKPKRIEDIYKSNIGGKATISALQQEVERLKHELDSANMRFNAHDILVQQLQSEVERLKESERFWVDAWNRLDREATKTQYEVDRLSGIIENRDAALKLQSTNYTKLYRGYESLRREALNIITNIDHPSHSALDFIEKYQKP